MKALIILLLGCFAHAQTVERKTAMAHPIEYYLSLPEGWSAAKRWPVVIVIESANRDFQQTAELFAKARGDMPFVIVAPLVVTNGGPSYRQAPSYRYSSAVWARIEREGGCRFDQEGIAAVADDLRKKYGGEDKYFLTGWEAGGHTIWTTTFQHPEALRAVAAAGTNYQGRCVDAGRLSSDASRATLPVKILLSGRNSDQPPNKFVRLQSEEAKKLAEEHGYRAISEQLLDVPHGPMAREVLAWFQSLLQP